MKRSLIVIAGLLALAAGCDAASEQVADGGDAGAGDAARPETTADGTPPEVAVVVPGVDSGSSPLVDGPDAPAPVDAPAADGPAPADAPPPACQKRQCGVHLACGRSSDGCGGMLDCPACSEGLNRLRLPARNLLFDSRRQRLYATVQGASPVLPNRLLMIDPVAMEVVDSLPVGSDPTVMALSADGSTLWLALNGASAIRRVDLDASPPVVGPLLPMPSTPVSMVVLPGAPRSVAAALSGSFSEVIIADDGVARPMATDRFRASIGMLAEGPAGLLYGYNNKSTAYDLFVLNVSPTGLSVRAEARIISGLLSSFVHADGRLYASTGQVVDVTNPDQPRAAGRFDFYGVLIARPNRRVTMLSSPPYPGVSMPMLRQLEADTFTEVTSTPVPVTDRVLTDLVLVQPDAVAFLGSPDFAGTGSTIYFFKHPSIRQ